ncbi:hypothetical protein A4F85_04575 [Delftia sp. GW456-R20]|nr:hypothetical protein A4F85_04575 [Delftia sp. GW456-R20]
MEWLYLASLPIAAAAVCYGLYALAFRERARGGWPIGFLVLAWLFAVVNMVGALKDRKAPAPAPIREPAIAAVPSQPAGQWTAERTTSSVAGPWLDYAPSGSRFCRAADGIIVTVFPPGVRPEAQAVDAHCLQSSVPSPAQL